ncbi:hypothetical protein T310_9603 [Rasamsonia emersonii CBS 393.64]|uniref:Uncharacterized protein n=1 Tax=Rasamsonia emersonii (strain ATCC 16479 / CBS 393.64 / IMI 116815) TaxID=1408163 RepID=A0A0F4YGN8_RASE3|nr:hypothetical protein T310_9603 [Rasamsonia emersonii CBS 393.64]KKA16783.1 hypothetical protein T310_9603 [Rasamsonia emersonii CBS 393.64]
MNMKLFLVVFLCSLVQVALAVQPHKSFVVTYPQDTPDSVLGQAKQAIKDAGGIITHEYHLIKYYRPLLSQLLNDVTDAGNQRIRGKGFCQCHQECIDIVRCIQSRH